MSRSGGRHENGRVRRMRKQFKKEGQEENAPCWVCHQPIDYEADYTNPCSHTCDHAKPISEYPELEYDYSNLRHAHNKCNVDRYRIEHMGAEPKGWQPKINCE